LVNSSLEISDNAGELLGGLSLFLYGTKMLSKNLKIVAGNYLKDLLATLSNSQIVGLFTGIIVTTLLQSSALVTVMLVEFVSGGYMSFSQTIGILLGSGIGSTTASQMMALNVKKYSLYLVTIGFIVQSISKTSKRQSTGGSLIGLGLIFYGADVLSHSVTPLRTYPPFLEFIVEITQHSFLALLVALLFSAFVQSASAAIGIVIVLAAQNLIQLKPAIAMVLGSNIGTSVTAVIAAFSSTNEAGHTNVSNREALRVATANILFKVIGM
jgi:phosphate:Na+ symporter